MHQLGAARPGIEPPIYESRAQGLLRETRSDELSPSEALDLVYRLRGLVAE